MSTQSKRYHHVHLDVLHPVPGIPVKGTPTVYQQAEKLGGKFTRIIHGLPRNGVANFSPSILQLGDKTIIAWRHQPEAFGFRYDNKYFYLNNQPNKIYIGDLVDDSTIVAAKNVRPYKQRLSLEDPRLFSDNNNDIYLQFVTSTYASKYDKRTYSRFNQPKVAVGLIDEVGEVVAVTYPDIGFNKAPDKPEKNWCFFTKDNELHCLYSTRNIIIESQSLKKYLIDSECLEKVTKGAPTFNSVAPIDLGDEYLVFYHWKETKKELSGRPYLEYKLSAYTMDKDLTKVTGIIEQPLFTGSINDELIEWTNYASQGVSRQPAVILPFGAYVDNNELVMSLGVNDHFMGIFRTDIGNILKLINTSV